MKITTPIPKPAAAKLKAIFSGRLAMVVYRLILIALATALLVAIIASGPGFLVAFLVTSVIAAWYMDDILAIISAIWNARFYELKL